MQKCWLILFKCIRTKHTYIHIVGPAGMNLNNVNRKCAYDNDAYGTRGYEMANTGNKYLR